MTTTTTSTTMSGASSSGLSGGMIQPRIATVAHAAQTSSYLDQLDPLRELGLELEQVQRSTRLLALTNPGEYEKLRDVDWTTLKTSVGNTYTEAMKQYLSVGLPVDTAKALALRSAEAIKEFSRQALELKFPSAANVIGQQVSIARSGALPGTISGSAEQAPAAPRRRRAAARKAPARKR
jgi:hypothetical protein